MSPNDKTTAGTVAALTETLKTKDPNWTTHASNAPLTSADNNMQHTKDPFTAFLQEKMHTPNMYELVQRLAHSGLPFYRLEWQRDRGYGELIKIFKCLTTKFTRNPSAMDKSTNKLKTNVKRAQEIKRGSSGGLMSGSTKYSFSGSCASNTVPSSVSASTAKASTRELYQVTDPVLLEELWASDLTLDLECLKANNLEYSYDSSAFNPVLLHRVTKYFSELLLKQNLRLAFLKEQIAYSKMTTLTPVTIRGKGKKNVTKAINENTAPNNNENAACRIMKNVTENVTKNATDSISANAHKCANTSAYESTNSKEARGVDTASCLMTSSDQNASLNVEAEAISPCKASKASRRASPLIVKAWHV